MKKFIIVVCLSLICIIMDAQTWTAVSWTAVPMKGQRTGVKTSSTTNIKQTMGHIKGHTFYAPNGKIYRGGTTWKVAKMMIDAQSGMKDSKTIVGISAKELHRGYPESELGNWFVDSLMVECAKQTGKKIDVGIVNFGGIRINMPGGEVYKEDIMSMFPFKNSMVYIELRGSDLLYWLNYMAEHGFQELGGVRCVVKDGCLTSATIDGKPIDKDKVYGIATISFLLDGGDGLRLGDNAVEVIECKGYLYDTMLKVVQDMYKAGKLIDANLDGRVQIYKDGKLIPPTIN